MKLPTWVYESAVAALVLGTTALLSRGTTGDWIAALAVWVSFGHNSVTDRLAEQQAHLPQATVHCYRLSARYWVLKELLWVAVWLLSGLYTALAGSLLFLAYPYWRKAYRRWWPARRGLEATP